MKIQVSRSRTVLCFALLVAAVTLAGVRLWHSPHGEARTRQETDRYRTTFAFRLDRERWCSFRVPRDKTLLKVVTNASVRADEPLQSEESFEYVIRYQALDDAGVVRCDRHYTLRTQRTFAFDDEEGDLVPARFYAGGALQPASSKVIMLPLDELAGEMAVLRVRLEDAHAAVADVSVRLYHRSEPPDYKLYYLWRRLPADQKQTLAQYNLYGAEALSRAERDNLLRARWVALAPLGIEGEDYTQQKMFVFREKGARGEVEQIWPEGLVVSERRRGIVPLPLETRPLLWRFRPLEAVAEFAPGASVELRCADPRAPGGRRTITIALRGPETRRLESALSGIVEVVTKSELVVNVEALGDGDWIDITPREHWLPGYLMDWGQPLDYAILEGGPLRLALRRLFLPGDDLVDRPVAFVRYEFLDAEGATIGGGELKHVAEASRLDRALGNHADATIGEATSHHFLLPEATRRVRLRGFDGQLVVSAYTRPPHWPRRVRSPEDYDPFARRHDGLREAPPTHRSWFLLHPFDANRRIDDDRRVLLGLQTRAPEEEVRGTRPRPIAPLDGHRAVSVLAPVDSSSALTPGARFWVPLPPGASQRLLLGDTLEARRIAPRLLVVRRGDRQDRLQLRVDGDAVVSADLVGQVDERGIGELWPGWHILEATLERASVDGATLYVSDVSGVAPVDGDPVSRFVRRTTHELEERLSFAVTREPDTESTLTGRVYVAAGERRRIVLRVDVEGERPVALPLASWTHGVTELDLGPPLPGGAAGTALLLAGEPQELEERRFFLRLGTDLRPGQLRIIISRAAGPRCWLQLSRRLPDRAAAQSIFVEDAPPRER